MTKEKLNNASTEPVGESLRPAVAGFSELFVLYSDAVFRYLIQRGIPQLDAYDFVAETFARAWEIQQRLGEKPVVNQRAWLLGIAKNVWREYVRSSVKQRAALGRLSVEPSWNRHLDDPADLVVNDTDVERLLDALPREQETAVRRTVLAELQASDVAKASDVSAASVRMNVKRGLDALRATLKKENRS